MFYIYPHHAVCKQSPQDQIIVMIIYKYHLYKPFCCSAVMPVYDLILYKVFSAKSKNFLTIRIIASSVLFQAITGKSGHFNSVSLLNVSGRARHGRLPVLSVWVQYPQPSQVFVLSKTKAFSSSSIFSYDLTKVLNCGTLK